MKYVIGFMIFILLPMFTVNAENYRFAVVPKYHSIFFDKSGRGCVFAASEIKNVECIYRGPEKGDVRIQDRIIAQLVEQEVDGIAVAVTESEFLARGSIQKAVKAGIPVITYDADFDTATKAKYGNLSLAYIGTDNFSFGYALGEELKKLRPQGGKLLIQTGRPDSPNLNLRIMGLRSALSGKNYQEPPGEKLENENGWTEIRAAIPNYDQTKRAMKQLDSAFKAPPGKINAFVSVGGWTQNNEQQYREIVAPFKGRIERKEFVVLIANASDRQLLMLGDHLANVNIGQNAYEMGKLAITTLYKIVTEQAYESAIYTELNHCTPENYKVCTKNIK